MARLIAISNLKGGSGKTTTAVNLGAAMAQQGKSVLVVDADPQAHATFCLGATPSSHADLGSVLLGGRAAEEVVIGTTTPGLQLIPASRRLIYFEKQHAANREARRYLALALKGVEKRFDFVIMDTPPTLGLLTVCCLVAARELYVPMQAHVLGMRGLLEMVQLVYKIRKHYNPALELRGVIPTFYNANARLSAAIVAEIGSHLGESAILPPVRTNIALAEAPRYGKSIFQFRKQSVGAVDYLRVAHAIEKLGAPEPAQEASPSPAGEPGPGEPPPPAPAAPARVAPPQETSSSVSLPGDGPVLSIPGRDEQETPSL